ncbi:hypothetical protein PQX77_012948 [Marasmius sp. AFHP31]|nr:hypothetical protein PQX77_012948 [Marasmius sp. AFHP31]
MAESEDEDCSFEELIDPLLEEYLQERNTNLTVLSTDDGTGSSLRRMTRAEVVSFENNLSQDSHGTGYLEAIALRKLGVERQRRRANVQERLDQALISTSTFFTNEELLSQPEMKVSENAEKSNIMDRLTLVHCTSYERSFLSRLHGSGPAASNLISVDWSTRTPWMNLMDEIREHYRLSHSTGKNHPIEECAPITYATLQAVHLDQAHDLLERSFWSGINVADSLDYSPEKCTVVALYKKLVVGVAILSSPRETYITYLAVKSGWDNSQIATWMLFHLIKLNPGKDITLHVSANNPAMLLYNRFGFKAEEFITGFYDAYVDPQSPASKNAIRLRLRQL